LEELPKTAKQEKPPIKGRATVHLQEKTGAPQLLASGFIYGIPDVPSQIPSQFYRDIGFRYSRAGGSQIPGNRGWASSVKEYEVRFASALSNYRTTREYGGDFIWLISDNWGADGGQPKDGAYPGDDGDWSAYDALLTRWIADAKSNDMKEGLIFDIWNEPDLHFFWNRSCEQWLELWSRTYSRLRKEMPDIRLSGPSLSAVPSADHEWWQKFLTHIKKTGEAPDQWAWHMEGGEEHHTMTSTVKDFRAVLEKHGLPSDTSKLDININEYATFPEQLPSAGAWWIAQLERQNTLGLRGNWAMAGALHDFMAGLVGKPGAGTDKYDDKAAGYWLTAEGQVYKYYASAMTGQRLKTEPIGGEGELGDVFATLDGHKIRVLVGTRVRTGNLEVEVNGFEKDGAVKVTKLLFKGDAADHLKEYGPPESSSLKELEVQSGKLLIPVDYSDSTSAFAFEIDMPR
jgi:hypothetical protein